MHTAVLRSRAVVSAAVLLQNQLSFLTQHSARRGLFTTARPCLRGVDAASGAAPDADNFVDIDALMGFSVPGVSTAPAPSPGGGDGVLGVVRVEVEEEGARYSRLQLPLDPAVLAAEAQQPRSNTRAGLAPGEEAAFADAAGGEAAASDFPTASPPATAGGGDDDHHHHDGDGRLPDPARLPYDDERFAEMLLEMEVNGVIDETWQDARKARVEDVKEIAEILTSLKVRDLCCIDVSEKTSNFDYMMFGTCEGPRHIHLAAWAAQDADKVQRISKIKRKQTDELWEVVPIGRIVLNLMVESFREEMTLERKWAVTRSMDPLANANAPISEGRQVKAHGLWTLTLNLQDLEDFEVDYCKDILMRQM